MKNIKWISTERGNIIEIYGMVNDIMMFNIIRFDKEPLPPMKKDKWLLSSNVIPMTMIKSRDLEVLKEESQKILENFINKIS